MRYLIKAGQQQKCRRSVPFLDQSTRSLQNSESHDDRESYLQRSFHLESSYNEERQAGASEVREYVDS